MKLLQTKFISHFFLDSIHETQLMSWAWLAKHFTFRGQPDDINLALLTTFNEKL